MKAYNYKIIYYTCDAISKCKGNGVTSLFEAKSDYSSKSEIVRMYIDFDILNDSREC